MAGANTWQAAGAGAASVGGNWTDGVPAVDSDIIFDNTSDFDCDWDIDTNVATFNMNSGYDGTVTVNGANTFNCAGEWEINAGTFTSNNRPVNVGEVDINNGTVNYGSTTITCGGDYASEGAATVDYGTSTVVHNATGTISTYDDFYNLTLGNGVITTLNGNIDIENAFTTGNGTSEITAINGSRLFNIKGGTFTHNGCTWTAGTGLSISTNGSTLTTFPAGDYGSTAVRISVDAVTCAAAGNIICGPFQVAETINGTDCVFDLADNDLTCTKVTVGDVASVNRRGKFMCGTGTIDVAGDVLIQNGANNELELEGCTMTFTGAWTNSGGVVTPATSGVTADGSGAQAITSGGDSFNDFTISNTGGTTSLVDAFASATLTTTDGSFDQNGQTITTSGAIDFTGTGGADTLTLDALTTVTGDAGITFGANWGTLTTTAGSFDLQGTGAFVNSSATNLTIKNMTCGANTKTTTITCTNEIRPQNGVVTLGAGTTTINGQPFYIRTTTETDPLVVNASATINGNAVFLVELRAGITVNVPALTTAGVLSLRTGHGSGTATINVTGNVTAAYLIYTKNAAKNSVFTTNGNQINTTGYFLVSNSVAGETLTINMGASACDHNGYVNFSCTQTTQLNMGTSAWTVAGNFTIGAGVTVAQGTSTLTLDGAAACALTSAGENLYDVTLNKTNLGLTLSDAFSCTGTLTTINGDFDQNGQAIAVAGAVDFSEAGAADTLTLDSSITKSGTGQFKISGWGSKSVSTAVIILQDTTTIDIGTITIDSIEFTGGKTYTWATTNDVTPTGWVSADISGSVGSEVTWVSATPATQYSVNAPASMVATYLDTTDCDNSGGTEIDAQSATNTGTGQNNVNILFANLTGVSPGTGPEGGGTTLTLSGNGFGAAQGTGDATADGVSLTSISWSDTSITGDTSVHAAGAVDVSVITDDGGTSTITNGFTFTATPTTDTDITDLIALDQGIGIV